MQTPPTSEQANLNRFCDATVAESPTNNEVNKANYPPTETESQPQQDEEFGNLPDPYPTAIITESLEHDQYIPHICAPNDKINKPSFSYIAGRGGMGGDPSIDNVKAVTELLNKFLGLPVILDGGGMSTSPMGSGPIFGKLTEVNPTDSSISLEIDSIWAVNHQNPKNRSVTLGSYQIAIPSSKSDCKDTIESLEAYLSGTISFINPTEQSKYQKTQSIIDTIDSISPGDTITIPKYSTDLTVISNIYDTYAVVSRRQFEDKTYAVQAFTVNNPNGGYYQIGIEQPSGDLKTNPEIPTAYIGGSRTSPPAPNTSFRRSSRFSSADITYEPKPQPDDMTIIKPDEEVLNSPLPERCIQTDIQKIDGIGEKTHQKLLRNPDCSNTAEAIAHTLYNNDPDDTNSAEEIKSIIDSLPQSDNIYSRLQSYTPPFENQ